MYGHVNFRFDVSYRGYNSSHGPREVENQLQAPSKTVDDIKTHLTTNLAEELWDTDFRLDKIVKSKKVDLKVEKQIEPLSQDIKDVKTDLGGLLAREIGKTVKIIADRL